MIGEIDCSVCFSATSGLPISSSVYVVPGKSHPKSTFHPPSLRCDAMHAFPGKTLSIFTSPRFIPPLGPQWKISDFLARISLVHGPEFLSYTPVLPQPNQFLSAGLPRHHIYYRLGPPPFYALRRGTLSSVQRRNKRPL